MKKIKIGEQEFEQCETIEDLPMKRWVPFKNHMLQDESGVDLPTLKNTFTEITREFDNGSMAGMYRSIYDYIYKLSNIENSIDHTQMMFALITFLPDEIGEKRTEADPSYLKSKLEIFAKSGLTQGQARNQVADFIGVLLTA